MGNEAAEHVCCHGSYSIKGRPVNKNNNYCFSPEAFSVFPTPLTKFDPKPKYVNKAPRRHSPALNVFLPLIVLHHDTHRFRSHVAVHTADLDAYHEL